MNNPPDPSFSDNKTYLVSGRLLNQLCKAVAERTPLAGDGLERNETPKGVLLSVDPRLLRAAQMEVHTLRVCHGGAEAFRDVVCSRAYIIVDDERVYLDEEE